MMQLYKNRNGFLSLFGRKYVFLPSIFFGRCSLLRVTKNESYFESSLYISFISTRCPPSEHMKHILFIPTPQYYKTKISFIYRYFSFSKHALLPYSEVSQNFW